MSDFEVMPIGSAKLLEQLKREIAAYVGGYQYLQTRMESLDRHGWAHDCDDEIEWRINGNKT